MRRWDPVTGPQPPWKGGGWQQQQTGQGMPAVAGCSLCGGKLERSDRAEPGSPFPYRCTSADCGGQCTGRFAADGSEHCDCGDDIGDRRRCLVSAQWPEQQQAVQPAGPAGNGQWPPIKPTTARWLNRKRRVRTPVRGAASPGTPSGGRRCSPTPGTYEQFEYGTDTPSTWRRPGAAAPEVPDLLAAERPDRGGRGRRAGVPATRTGQLIGRAAGVSPPAAGASTS